MIQQLPLTIRNLGLRDYQTAWQEMRAFTEQRNAQTCDEAWLLEHPHVFTQGKAGKAEHVLDAGDVPIMQTDRGGQVTYHGPGQLIVYFLCDIRRAKIGVKQFVHLLEKTVVDTLAEYNIQAQGREDAPGVYLKTNGAKICSLGLRIYRGCSYHGLALNVTTNLDYFKRINPCGFKNLTMANISDFVPDISTQELTEKIIKNLKQNFGYESIADPKNQNTTCAGTMRKPPWIRNKLLSPDEIAKTKKLLHNSNLATVCDEAACPNRNECFGRGTATFMIMGKTCTRNCRFCNVTCGKPLPLDSTEPQRLADTIAIMGLKYVVITSVCRDDLPDEGAEHFVACIQAIRKTNPLIQIEILVPDFQKSIENALNIFSAALPEVFAHNIETVPRLYSSITPSRNYQHSLKLLQAHKQRFPNIATKSGIMVGLGETTEEIKQVLQDLREHDVTLLTIGQYLQPQFDNAKVQRYLTPDEFVELGKYAKEIGFTHVASGPMVRSSYYAEQMVI